MQGNPKATDELNILAFPRDDATWRLDWFGDVAYQRHVRYKQPLIRIALSKVTLDANGSWDYQSKFPEQNSVAQAVVPIGLLPPLRIGTIWQAGSMVADPEYAVEGFEFIASHENIDLVKSGVPEGKRGFLLPFDTHPYHRAHTKSYCLRASLGDGRILIVPAMEAIRFYFGSSGTLLSRLFKAPFEEANLWTKATLDEKRAAEIELAEGISGVSAADVARIAFSKAAHRAAKTIASSLLATSGKEEAAHPKMLFPFYGRTQMRVRGVWLKGVEPAAFLAFQILSCSHSFPFATLRYTQQRRQRSDEPGAGAGSEAGGNDTLHAPRKKNEKKAIVNDAPGQKRAARPLRFVSENRFPDLDYKSVSRTDSVSPVRVVVTETTEEAAGFSVGESEGRNSYGPVETVSVSAAPILKGHPLEGSIFAQAVETIVKGLLAEGTDVWFVPLSAKQRYPQFSVMPEIVLDGGRIHPLSHIEVAGKRRERYVTVLRVKSRWPEKQKVWVLPEAESGVERRPGSDQVIRVNVEGDELVDAGWLGRIVAASTID